MSSYMRMKFDPFEIKILILYILRQADRPLTAINITDIVLSDSLLEFFETHMYITELIHDNQIAKNDDDTFMLTDDGREAVAFFQNRIPYSIRERIAGKMKELKKNEEMDSLVWADYTPVNEQEYTVHFRLCESPEQVSLELSFNVSGKELAKDLCKRWREDYSELYAKIVGLLD